MNWYFLTTYVAIGWVIRVAMVPVILRRQFAPGAGVAWLGIVFLHPYIGLLLYMMVGETRLGPHRVERHRQLAARYRPGRRDAGRDPEHRRRAPVLPASYEPMVLQAEKISGMPVLGGNAVEFLPDAPQMVARLVADIDAA